MKEKDKITDNNIGSGNPWGDIHLKVDDHKWQNSHILALNSPEIWVTDIRTKSAIAAMQSLMLNPTFSEKEVAERAVKQADALIEELKKKDNGSVQH